VIIVTHDPRVSAATTRTLRVDDGTLFDEKPGTSETPPRTTDAAEAPP